MSLEKKHRLTAVAGMKVICVWMIFLGHARVLAEVGLNSNIDMGELGCGILFASSGFLMAYSYEGKFQFTLEEIIELLKKKWKMVYPIHIFCFLLSILWMFPDIKAQNTIFETIVTGIANLALIQAWFPELRFSFNGVSWFLSALLFCYAMTPVISKLIQGKGKKEKWILMISIFMISVFRFYRNIWFPVYFKYHFHTDPIIRCLEFFMAYIAGSFFIESRKKHGGGGEEKIRYSFVELMMILLVFGTEQLLHGKCLWVWFQPLWIMFVYIFAVNRGIISKILGARCFQWFSKIELEFFMLHLIVLNYVEGYLQISGVWKSFVGFMMTILMSVAWKRTLLFFNRKDKND